MNIDELWNLLAWSYEIILAPKLSKRFAAIQGILANNLQANQTKQPFEEPVKQLSAHLRAMPMSQLTTAQLSFLEHIGIRPLIGVRGADYLEGVLYRNSLDPATAAQKVLEIVEQLNKGADRLNHLRTGLDGLVLPVETPPEGVVVRVTFSHHAAIQNVVDLKRRSANWHDIARGIAMAIGLAPEDVQVLSAHRGSIVVDFVTVSAFASVLSVIVHRALDAALKVQNVRLLGQQVRALELRNNKLEAEFASAEEQELAHRIDAIVKETAQLLQLEEQGNGDKYKAFRNAVSLLVNFADRGGEVDFVLRDEAPATAGADAASAEQARKRQELRNTAMEIRRIESKLREIGYSPSADAGEDSDGQGES